MANEPFPFFFSLCLARLHLDVSGWLRYLSSGVALVRLLFTSLSDILSRSAVIGAAPLEYEWLMSSFRGPGPGKVPDFWLLVSNRCWRHLRVCVCVLGAICAPTQSIRYE